MPGVTSERAKEVLDYDPETGTMTWKKRDISSFTNTARGREWNARYAGRRVGLPGKAKYAQVKIDGTVMRCHSVAWLISHGAFPDGEIDHRNGDKYDFRLDNLRDAHHAGNLWNRKVQKNNKTGLKGVSPISETGRYAARIAVRGKQYYLGSFGTAEAAHAAYAKASTEFHGEFSRLD